MCQKSGIYQIRSLVNNKIYIGSSKNINKRLGEHLWRLNNNQHDNKHLQRHFQKYGKCNCIEFSIIEYCSIKDLSTKEQRWINLLSPEFNICKIVYSSRGVKRSEKTKQKLSIKMKTIGMKPPGRKTKLSEKERDRFYNMVVGNTFRAIKVFQLDLDGNIINEFSSSYEASRETGISQSSITNVCNGKRRIAGGFRWSKNLSELKPLKNINRGQKRVSQIDITTGISINEFSSISEASRYMGVTIESISRVCRGERESCKGYKWKFI